MSPEANKVGQDTFEIQKSLEEKEKELVSQISTWVLAAEKKVQNPEFTGFLFEEDCVHLVVKTGGELFALGGGDWDENPGLYQIKIKNKDKGSGLPFFSLARISPISSFSNLDRVDWGGKAGKRWYFEAESLYTRKEGIFRKKTVLSLGDPGPETGYCYSGGLLLDYSQITKGTIKEKLNALIPDKEIYSLLLDGLYRAAGESK